MCILRFYVPVDMFVPLFGNDPAVVKVSGDTIIIDPDAKTEDGDSSQIPNPLTVHNSLVGLQRQSALTSRRRPCRRAGNQ